MNYSTAYYDYSEQKWKDDKEGFIKFHEHEVNFYSNFWFLVPNMTEEEGKKIADSHKEMLKQAE